MNEIDSRFLPADDEQRRVLHNEVHARPSARVRLPALITYVALLNEGVTREQELAQLQRLPGHADLSLQQLQGNFLRLRCEGYTVKWERHTEFTRYSIVQPLPVQGQSCGHRHRVAAWIARQDRCSDSNGHDGRGHGR